MAPVPLMIRACSRAAVDERGPFGLTDAIGDLDIRGPDADVQRRCNCAACRHLFPQHDRTDIGEDDIIAPTTLRIPVNPAAWDAPRGNPRWRGSRDSPAEMPGWRPQDCTLSVL